MAKGIVLSILFEKFAFCEMAY